MVKFGAEHPQPAELLHATFSEQDEHGLKSALR